MKMTLLELTQSVLAALNEDNVNSIGDTQASADVALFIKNTYMELFAHTNLPSREGLLQLQGLADVTRPNYLQIPDNVSKIDWIKYRNLETGNYEDMQEVTQERFFQIVFNSAKDSYTTVVDESGVTMFIQDNKAPRYWTVLNNRYVVFDSWNKGLENTMHQNNVAAFGEVTAAWVHEDTFVPDIPAELFPRLLAESTAVASINIKNISNIKAESQSRRQLIKWQQFKRKNRPQYELDYSRKR
jgi:hypothetical protein